MAYSSSSNPIINLYNNHPPKLKLSNFNPNLPSNSHLNRTKLCLNIKKTNLFVNKIYGLSISNTNSPLNHTKSCLNIKRNNLYVNKNTNCDENLGQKCKNNDGLLACMCSTTPFIGFNGKVGLQRREGNISLLYFGGDNNINQIGCNNNNNNNDSNDGGGSSNVLSAMLPFVVVVTAIAALSQPSTFTWVSKELYAPALGGIMLSIGIRLSLDDFKLAIQRPLPLSLGFLAQYVLKPILGVLIAQAFGIPPMFYAGFILTACVAGAQLSSYASFLSKGDVALSILLTSSSTIASVVITPLLTRLLIGSVVPVDAIAMAKSILQVVLVPVSLGLLLNTYAKSVVKIIQPVMPVVAMVCTSLCIGSPLAINRGSILSIEGLRLLTPVLAFHLASFVLGYWLAKLPVVRQEEEVSRTISLCTGMQSSTLAGLLATQFLGSSQAVPSACSVVAMAIMGLSLASFWGTGLRIRDLRDSLSPSFHPTIKSFMMAFQTSQHSISNE